MDIIDLIAYFVLTGSYFLCVDLVFIRLFKLKGFPSILIAFIILVTWSVYDMINSIEQDNRSELSGLDVEYLDQNMYQLLFSAIWSIFFLSVIKNDKERKQELEKLPDDTMLEIKRLVDLSNVSKRIIKYYSFLGVLPYIKDEQGNPLYAKGDSIRRLVEIKQLKKNNVKNADLINHLRN